MDSPPPSPILSPEPTPFMDYSPAVSPLTSPESTPPLSPLHAIDEPKTLSEQELDAHRAMAQHIVNTHTHEEATRIFMEGLIPVDGLKPEILPNKKNDVKPKILTKAKKVFEIGEIGEIAKNGSQTP